MTINSVQKSSKSELSSGIFGYFKAWTVLEKRSQNVQKRKVIAEKGIRTCHYFFTFLGMLKKVPVEKWLWDEMAQIERIKFKFGEDKGAFKLSSTTAVSLQTHPPAEALAGNTLLYEYQPRQN